MKAIHITIEVPDGVSVSVAREDAGQVPHTIAEYVPPFADELIPLPPEVVALAEDVNVQPGFAQGAAIAQPTPFRASATGVVPPDYCPVHRMPWKVVPAGTSKSTGRPYNAFWGCSAPGKCSQRPPSAFLQTHPIAAA